MRELFNDGWQFAKLHVENAADENGKTVLFTPQQFYSQMPSSFADVCVPHDYLIYNTNALYENSVGFYRKHFSLKNILNRHYFLRFEGVYMNSAVYVNGNLTGVWKYGYTSFEFDITPFVKEGENIVEVIAVYQNPNSRWYSGAGIFRDVTLVTTDSARIAPDGIYFSSKKNLSNEWTVKIQTEISGEYEGCTVQHVIFPFHDNTENALKFFDEQHDSLITKTLQPAMGTAFDPEKNILLETTTAVVKNPALWKIENPAVYILQTVLIKDGKIIDRYSQQIGFRTIEFDSNRGFFLNGNHVKIYGVCEHHDLGSLGSAFNVIALKRKFRRLKEMGVNAIRTSHNPQTTAFLNLADQMGFLIDNECFDMWEKPKTKYDYGNYFIEWHERDCQSWVRKDRNHPAVIMWSIGNEIYDTHQGNGFSITKDLSRIVRKDDPCKNAFITIGSNYMEWEGAQKCAEEIDAAGYNYGERLYEKHHASHPEWKIYGSETASTVQSRGVYHFPLSNRLLTYQDGQCSSLGNCSTNWGSKNSAWNISQDRDTSFSAGQFIWTGFDYIGEPTPYFSKNSFFGQIDTAGFKKDTFYVYKAAWTSYKKAPFVHLLPYWDFNEGQIIDVRVYSNAPFVELFRDGISLGKKENDVSSSTELSCDWTLEYKKGILTAIAYDENAKEIARDQQKSFGDACVIKSSLEEDSEDGIYFIDISSFDKENNPVSNSRSRINFEVTGDAQIIGCDNGDSTDYEQYKSSDGKHIARRLFNNKLLVIVKAKSLRTEFSFTIKSPSLQTAVYSVKNGAILAEQNLSPADNAALLAEQNLSPADKTAESAEEIPIRKIELICEDNRNITPQNKIVKVKAIIHPSNATFKELQWKPMQLEGVKSDSVKINVTKSGSCETAEITGISDGEFRLTCTASNGSNLPQVISELEFTVSGFGKATRNPYEFIEACKCSSSSSPVKLSFEGGVFTEETRSWFSFDKVDFGSEGSDTVTLPIFSFSDEVDLELWEGNPDSDGKLIMPCHYSAKSWYNHYQSNTFVLPRRLFGVHEITILFNNRMSLKGFEFQKSPKAFAVLNALDASLISGDSFTKTADCVTGIGNNVALEFDSMDFGTSPAKQLTLCGNSHVNNTIHILFTTETGTVNRIIEFEKTSDWKEKTFSIEGVSGKCKVTFLFLPGSNFDFKYFKFS